MKPKSVLEEEWADTLHVLSNRAVRWNDPVAKLCISVIKHGIWDERRDFSSGARKNAQELLIKNYREDYVEL